MLESGFWLGLGLGFAPAALDTLFVLEGECGLLSDEEPSLHVGFGLGLRFGLGLG